MQTTPELPDVYSAAEIARAAVVHLSDVLELVASGNIAPVQGRFFAAADAIAAVHALQGRADLAERPLFNPARGVRREPGLPLALSGTLHAARSSTAKRTS